MILFICTFFKITMGLSINDVTTLGGRGQGFLRHYKGLKDKKCDDGGWDPKFYKTV